MLIRITCEHEDDIGQYQEVRISDEADINDVVEALKGLLVAHGFHPNTVDDAFTNERWNEESKD